MAIYVKPIPTLSGKAAERFLEKEERSRKNPGTIPFKKQMKQCEAILKKAKLI